MSGKPLGVGIGIDIGGSPRFFVSPINRVTDLIWDAVREAICANMTPEQFKQEAAQAWQSHLKDDAKSAVETLEGRRNRGF